MPHHSACLLGSINLSEYVIDPFTEEARVDYDELKKDVAIYVDALNECLEENLPFLPLPEQREAVAKYRAIGLGYFGLGDMFIKLGMRYGSVESLATSRLVSAVVAKQSIIASSELVGKYPMPTLLSENKEKIFTSDFYRKLFGDHNYYVPVNTSILTCAPTGSLSTMIGVSGGIEPIFSLSMMRKTESLNDGEETWYEIDIPVINEWKKHNSTEELPEWITQSTSMNIHWRDRVLFQSMWQKYIDNAISSTVNLAEETTVEEVEELYMHAWRMGLKGITIYRSGCRRGAILTEKVNTETFTDEAADCGIVKEELKWGDTISCSDDLVGLKRKVVSGCGSLHVEAFYDWDGRLQEVFFNKGSDGGCNSFMVGLSRMTSLAARTGASLEKIVDQFASVPSCASYVVRTATKRDTSKGKNCPNAIGNALLEMQREIESIIEVDQPTLTRSIVKMGLIEKSTAGQQNKKTAQQCIDEGICPVCYGGGEEVNLVAGEGCYSCARCGFSRCD